MRRPPAVIAARSAAALLLVLGLSACNDKLSDVGEEQASAETNPPLVPFASDFSDDDAGEPLTAEPPETDPPETDPPETEPDDTKASREDEPEDTEAEAEDTEVEIDPMPGDTATFDTKPADDPLCKAAKRVVDANTAYERQLDKALKVSPDKPRTLVTALKKLPLERLRDAYDDLSAEVPDSLRRRVATIRDFTLKHGEQLVEVEDFDGLSELIAEIESDPAASKVTKANLAVSKYTEEECGIKIAQGA